MLAKAFELMQASSLRMTPFSFTSSLDANAAERIEDHCISKLFAEDDEQYGEK